MFYIFQSPKILFKALKKEQFPHVHRLLEPSVCDNSFNYKERIWFEIIFLKDVVTLLSSSSEIETKDNCVHSFY